jgi:hypothetical protein
MFVEVCWVVLDEVTVNANWLVTFMTSGIWTSTAIVSAKDDVVVSPTITESECEPSNVMGPNVASSSPLLVNVWQSSCLAPVFGAPPDHLIAPCVTQVSNPSMLVCHASRLPPQPTALTHRFVITVSVWML